MVKENINKKVFKSVMKNAFMFFEESSENLKEEKLELSVSHLATSIELLLKALLINEHWALIFSDIDKAKIEHLKTGELHSVSTEKAFERIKDILEKDIKFNKLKNLISYRNQIIHYHIEHLDKNKVYGELYSSLSYVVDKILSLEEFEEFENKIQDIQTYLSKLEEYLKRRYEDLKPEIEKNERKLEVEAKQCPRCKYSAVFLKDRTLKEDSSLELPIYYCWVCMTDFNFGKYYHDNYETYEAKEFYCSECECNDVFYNEELDIFYCYNCEKFLKGSDYNHCGYCGTAVIGGVQEHSDLFGCPACDGHPELHKD